MNEETIRSCQECGASIYPEHIISGKAGYAAGKLMCPHCMRDAGLPRADDPMDNIALVDGGSEPAPAPIHPSQRSMGGSMAGTTAGFAGTFEDGHLRRPLSRGAQATRCRTFHAKLNDGALAFMNNQINEWIDGDDRIEIKQAVSNIGVVEGKHSEPHLIITIFY